MLGMPARQHPAPDPGPPWKHEAAPQCIRPWPDSSPVHVHAHRSGCEGASIRRQSGVASRRKSRWFQLGTFVTFLYGISTKDRGAWTMKKKAFYGWKLLAAFWFIYLVNLGFPTYGQSVVNAYMAKDLHLDRTMLGLAFSLYMLMVGLPGPAVAALVNRIGVRKTLLIGSCSAMLGAISMGLFVHTGWQAVISFGILIGFGSCAGGAIAEQQG